MHSSVPEREVSMMCFMEKTLGLDELRSGMSSSTAGHEFNVNESMMYIKYGVFKQKQV